MSVQAIIILINFRQSKKERKMERHLELTCCESVLHHPLSVELAGFSSLFLLPFSNNFQCIWHISSHSMHWTLIQENTSLSNTHYWGCIPVNLRQLTLSKTSHPGKSYRNARQRGEKDNKSTSKTAEIPSNTKGQSLPISVSITPKSQISHNSLKAHISTADDKRSCKPGVVHLAWDSASDTWTAGWEQELILKIIFSFFTWASQKPLWIFMGESRVDTTVFVIQDNHIDFLWTLRSVVLKGFSNNF